MLFKKLGIPALIYLLILSIGFGPAIAHAHGGNSASAQQNEIELAPMSANQVSLQGGSGDFVITLPPEALDKFTTACQLESSPNTTLGDRCSKAAIDVLSSYSFVLSEIAFFASWWVYNYLAPNPFDPAPIYAGNGVTTTVLGEYFGTFDVMNQKAISNEQDWRVGRQQEVIEQSLDVVRKLKKYQLDPSQGKEALELSIEKSKKLLTKLGFSPQGQDWQKQWNQAIQNLTKGDNFDGRSIDFISRNLRSPLYSIFFSTILVAWMTTNSLMNDSVDPYPFPYLNTLLCALTNVESCLVLKVMKSRAVKEQERDATTELLDARHLIQMIENAEAESGLQPSAEAVKLSIPTLNEIPVPQGSDLSPILSRGIHRINRTIASYPYIATVLLITGGWMTFNSVVPNPIDPGPTFQALNLTDAILQEYFSIFELMAQNSTHREELRIARLHNTLLGKTLNLTEFLSPEVSHSPAELKAKFLEIRSSLQEQGLPTNTQEMDTFYKEKTRQINLNQDQVTDFIFKYLRTWGYFGFLTLATVSWMTANTVAPGAIDPYPFVAFNIALTVWITTQGSFIIRIMLRQNDTGVLRRQKLYLQDALKLTELLPADETQG
jgi:uncharacterized membrane protein